MNSQEACKIIINEDEKEHFPCEECKQEFSIYSPAPDPLESLNREKVIEICDKYNAKGLRSVLGCQSRLVLMYTNRNHLLALMEHLRLVHFQVLLQQHLFPEWLVLRQRLVDPNW